MESAQRFAGTEIQHLCFFLSILPTSSSKQLKLTPCSCASANLYLNREADAERSNVPRRSISECLQKVAMVIAFAIFLM
jgi:hypothetical protein